MAKNDMMENPELIDVLNKYTARKIFDACFECSQSKEIDRLFIDAAIDADDVIDYGEHESEVDGLNESVKALESDLNAKELAIEIDAERLHEAICEGRRQDAIDILSDMTNAHFRSVAQQKNLFGDRIPA
jgi:hypothetical protein